MSLICILQISMHAYLVHANIEVGVTKHHKGFDADAVERIKDLRVPVSSPQFQMEGCSSSCTRSFIFQNKN